MAIEPAPDHPALREGRRRRLFEAMDRHDLDLLVLGRVANIRYATGVPILWNAGTRPFGPGAVVVRATEELYLLSTWDEGVPPEIPHSHLFGITWNPMNYVTLLRGIAAEAKPARVGTDAMSPLFAQLLPMAFADTPVVDAGPALREARRTKTPEEVDAIRAAIAVAETAMAAAAAELRPGVTERQLTATFMEAMATTGVTTPAVQDVVRIRSAAGDRGAPGDRVVQAGDLVSFDAGVVADGYAGEVGRTWQVPGGAPADDLFRRAEDLCSALLDACSPGAPASGLLDAYRAAGETLPTGPVARGLGLGFDDPVVAAELPETAARERLDPGLVLVLDARAADGARGSVAIREPVVVTADGAQVLTRTPRRPTDRTGAPT